MAWVFIVGFGVIVAVSVFGFMFLKQKDAYPFASSRFSVELFVTLVIIYIIVILGFGAIYFTLSLQGIVLVEHNELKQMSVMGSLAHSIYFSGVTMLTIGYGDIAPVGIGRLIAIIEALIGYILPAAFVLKVVQFTQRDREY
ncbi:potassium channel family protein [Lentibacillus saliphilus]|uniref:potassium channel family protein n=1 Tax=Lentibacillus saliphilus TaxID=2737028 RepID=UPI001C2F5834